MAPIAIEGTIGSGKSTLLDAIERTTLLKVRREPVDAWVPWLTRAYRHRDSHFQLQTRIMLDTCTHLPDADIVERSPALQPYTFIPAMIGDGGIREEDADLLAELHRNMLTWRPQMTIFLRCSFPECLRRIKERRRKCEKDLDVSYLERLHNLYERTVERFPDILVIDTTEMTPDEVADACLEIVIAIKRDVIATAHIVD